MRGGGGRRGDACPLRKKTEALQRELALTIPRAETAQLTQTRPPPISDWLKSDRVTQEHTVYKLAIMLGSDLEQTALTSDSG